MNQALLVLGANGFVGRRLLVRLAQSGSSVVHTISRHLEGLPVLPDVYHHQGNIDDAQLLRKLLPECDAVIHLAWATTPGASALRPLLEAEDNLLPSLQLLEVLQDYPHKFLVYLSSGGACYGNPGALPATEHLALAPHSYYGAAKAALEHFIQAFCQQQQRSAVILRPANFYGPGQFPKPGFGIVPTWMTRLRAGLPLDIWGDGEIVRDYLYLDDFLDLLLAVLKNPPPTPGMRLYNAGSGKGVSLNHLAQLVEQITGQTAQRIYHPNRAVDVPRIVLDCLQARRDYGWQAYTDLVTGLGKTWEWIQTQNS